MEDWKAFCWSNNNVENEKVNMEKAEKDAQIYFAIFMLKSPEGSKSREREKKIEEPNGT